MAALRYLSVRDAQPAAGLDPTIRKLLIALVVLGFLSLTLAATLVVFRYVRRSRSETGHARSTSQLPMYECHRRTLRSSSRLTVTTSAGSGKRGSAFVAHEKEILMADADADDSPPSSPVPEIRITFPEELDERGRRQSGRVVVVRVGDNGIGLEPVPEDLPAYQQHQGDRFHSLDLERIGGLKEKDMC